MTSVAHVLFSATHLSEPFRSTMGSENSPNAKNGFPRFFSIQRLALIIILSLGLGMSGNGNWKQTLLNSIPDRLKPLRIHKQNKREINPKIPFGYLILISKKFQQFSPSDFILILVRLRSIMTLPNDCFIRYPNQRGAEYNTPEEPFLDSVDVALFHAECFKMLRKIFMITCSMGQKRGEAFLCASWHFTHAYIEFNQGPSDLHSCALRVKISRPCMIN